ncbi:hypothetical protein NPIL_185551 [Nephila pilipes]|uniref:Uncharacterized protein n=1 Tax=Nephila pilipes TaxID=299642 RepID=A0A8X6MQ49_NEPPI|nr:hypothetical protein NPIL_185551 [Nephila pilipes]
MIQNVGFVAHVNGAYSNNDYEPQEVCIAEMSNETSWKMTQKDGKRLLKKLHLEKDEVKNSLESAMGLLKKEFSESCGAQHGRYTDRFEIGFKTA